MNSQFLIGAAASLFLALADGPTSVDSALLTVAEKSEYRATARHAEVVALLDHLASASPRVRRTSLGLTGEGREMPVVIIADAPVSTPQDAGDRIIVFALGNIHAGEVDGKEALPMLARELALAPHHPLLKDLIVILAPLYNADGNERVSKNNRPGQLGPEEGMGRRENAAGLDLNRDFIKLEAPETRGLVAFLNRWDPAVFIDTHTTNGCFHRYVITFEGPKTPAGDRGVIEFVRDKMLPDVARVANEKYGVPAFTYGDFNREHTRWDTYPPSARFGTSYVGLRNRISVLSEGYSYAPYRTRVEGTRDFVKSCLEYAASHKAEIRQLLADADARATAGAAASVAIRFEPVAADKKVLAAGFVEETRDKRPVSTGVPRDYEVELWNRYQPALAVRRPAAYLIPAALTRVIETLRLHGVELRPLNVEREIDVEIYRIAGVKFADEPFQNHKLATVEVEARSERHTLPAGTIEVSTAQPLGSLVVYLLEPQCEDGLTAWNFLDESLVSGAEFPILRRPR